MINDRCWLARSGLFWWISLKAITNMHLIEKLEKDRLSAFTFWTLLLSRRCLLGSESRFSARFFNYIHFLLLEDEYEIKLKS